MAPRKSIEIAVDVLVASVHRAGFSHEVSRCVGYNLCQSGKDVAYKKYEQEVCRGLDERMLWTSTSTAWRFRRLPYSPNGRSLRMDS